MELIILGCGSATPTLWRKPSAQILSFEDAYYLIDCAEGTQVRLLENKIKPKYLKAIFISHLHGDHYLGLMGLLWTLELSGRTQPLQIIAPNGLRGLIVKHLKLANSELRFRIEFVDIPPGDKGTVYSDDRVVVDFFPLEHGIPCSGMKFTEVILRRSIDPAAIKKFSLTNQQIKAAIGSKAVFNKGGNQIDREQIFLPNRTPKSYCYCTDTLPLDSTIEQVAGCDLLYHEATYERQFSDKAIKHKHSTSIEAAEIAKAAKVKHLVIGHFSSRYKQVDVLLSEACSVFPNTIAAEDCLRIKI
jgi:ribonuclease Z